MNNQSNFFSLRCKYEMQNDLIFYREFVWCKWNGLTNKLSLKLSFADFDKRIKFVFSWLVWAVYGFTGAMKGSEPHSHLSHLPQFFVIPQILLFQTQNKKNYCPLKMDFFPNPWNLATGLGEGHHARSTFGLQTLSWTRKASYSLHHAVEYRWLELYPKFLCWSKLLSECHGLLRRFVQLRSNSMLRCVVPVEEVRCIIIAL